VEGLHVITRADERVSPSRSSDSVSRSIFSKSEPLVQLGRRAEGLGSFVSMDIPIYSYGKIKESYSL
jgi:hypothetical protein